MPLVERTYRVSKKVDDRAIGGLSMGGGQSINVAFNRPELFRYVILMSPLTPQNADQTYPAFFKDPAMPNKQFKLLWLGVGKDDTLVGNGVKSFEAVLTAKGVKHTFVVGEGAHEWTVWRHHLHDVAPMLFR
jgi:enterochelin esterase-like enzyme